MYIMINNVMVEKMIDLSYPICSNKEITVITMLSDNIEYKIVKPNAIDYILPGNEKQILSGTYAGRELLSIVEGMIELSNISLEYEIVTQPTLARSIKAGYDEYGFVV